MDRRSQFTFYTSFYDAVSRIKKAADRALTYDAICRYAIFNEAPDLEKLPDSVQIAFLVIQPILDSGRKKAKSGKAGGSAKRVEANGSKREANGKQTEANGSKREANGKQTEANGSKREANEKQEKESWKQEKEQDKEQEKEQDKEQEKEQDKEQMLYPPLPPSRGQELQETLAKVWASSDLSPSLEAALLDWARYKAERREAYKPVGLKQLLSRAQNAAAEYGDNAVAAMLNQSMAANYQGPVWDWLKDGRIQPAAPQKSKAAQELDGFYQMASRWASEEETG